METLDYFESSTALQRLGQPGEMAKIILSLVSDDASFVIGTELHVDGGLTNYAYNKNFF
ncbi:SDR family oxidoreductase [Marivirga sp. S37H4]|uniref:SDR family oxidoreductase n=1 Tax=Marivirga aurantiaca TaxID=2802615 RepID=A0A935C9H6_9BACT|nr:SDR family oxidoreductase [Marivirga aurantiaca]